MCIRDSGLVEHYFRNKTELLLAANRSVNETYLERVAGAVGDLAGLAALEVRLRKLLPYTQTVLDEWRVRLVFWHPPGPEPVPYNNCTLPPRAPA